jgi:hypothetical protein
MQKHSLLSLAIAAAVLAEFGLGGCSSTGADCGGFEAQRNGKYVHLSDSAG